MLAHTFNRNEKTVYRTPEGRSCHSLTLKHFNRNLSQLSELSIVSL